MAVQYPFLCNHYVTVIRTIQRTVYPSCRSHGCLCSDTHQVLKSIIITYLLLITTMNIQCNICETQVYNYLPSLTLQSIISNHNPVYLSVFRLHMLAISSRSRLESTRPRTQDAPRLSPVEIHLGTIYITII